MALFMVVALLVKNGAVYVSGNVYGEWHYMSLALLVNNGAVYVSGTVYG